MVERTAATADIVTSLAVWPCLTGFWNYTRELVHLMLADLYTSLFDVVATQMRWF
jgi:hypothetical protein